MRRWVDPAVFGSFIGLVIFVASVLVQGVVHDYKESERITSELFAAFQGLTAAVQVALHPPPNPQHTRARRPFASRDARASEGPAFLLHFLMRGRVRAPREGPA